MPRSRALAGLFVAEAVSLVGSRVTFVAVPWLVLETTGSAAQMGVVAFAEMLPYVAACVFGGPVVDQCGPRRMSIVCDLASVLPVAVVPILTWADLLPFAALVLVMALAGGLRGLGDVAKRPLLPVAAQASKVDLTRAAGLRDGTSRLSELLGAPLGALLVEWFGAANVLLVDAGSFALAAMVVAVGVRVRTQPAEEHEPYGAALRAGFSYIRQDTLILGIALLVLATNLFDQAYLVVLAPSWVKDTVGSASALGLVFGAFGLGAVVGNLVFSALAPRLPRYATLSVCFLLGGAPHYLVMAWSTTLTPVLAVVCASGLVSGALNPILAAVTYERVPRHLHGRVLGLIRAIAWGGLPLGGLLGGLVAQGLGVTNALLLAGGLYLALTLVPFVMTSWREMDTRPEPSPTEPRPASVLPE